MRHRSARTKKTRGKNLKQNSETVGGKLNLGQVQSARLLVLIIEQCHGLSPSYHPPPPPTFSPLEFIQQQILSRIDRTHYGTSGVGVRERRGRGRGVGTRLQKSLIRSLGFSEHYGRRWSIDRSEIANWKTLPIGARRRLIWEGCCWQAGDYSTSGYWTRGGSEYSASLPQSGNAGKSIRW